MARFGSLLAAMVTCLFGCRGAPPPEPIESQLALAVAALREGNYEEGGELIAQARARDPRHPLVARWSAVVAEMLWREDEAIRELTAAIRLARQAAAPEKLPALQGDLGDLLFQVGRWGESAAPLLAGAVARDEVRRRAFAAIATTLPYARRFAGPLVTEQQLLPGDAPEFVCGTRDWLRPFAIDTGTSMTTVAASFAEELGVRTRQDAGTALDAAGKPLSIEIGQLPQFYVGSVDVGAVPVLVVADQALRLRDQHGGAERVPRGVLGLDLLSACRLTIDPERGSVVLERPQKTPIDGAVQCVQVDGRCLAPVFIEGQRLWFVLDTGASHSSLSETGVRDLAGAEERAVPSFRRVHTVGGGTVAVREVRGLVLRCSDARFLDVTLPVVPRGEGVLFPVHGVLGVDLLARCRVTLDRGRVHLLAVR
ncbi:MAG: aspartyl protease family protein [Planctomycetota bacterium]